MHRRGGQSTGLTLAMATSEEHTTELPHGPSELPALCASGSLQPRVISGIKSNVTFPLMLRGVGAKRFQSSLLS